MSLKTIIIYRLGSLGDTVVALPCFHKIHQFFPNHRKIVLTNHPVSSKAIALESLLLGSGLIDGVIKYKIGLRSVSEFLTLIKSLKTSNSNILIYLNPPRGFFSLLRDLMFFRFCGFKKIIGAPLSFDLLKCRQDFNTGFFEFEAQRLARTLLELGSINLQDNNSWGLMLSPDELHLAANAVSGLNNGAYFTINMGGKVKINDWGESNWINLIQKISSRIPNFSLVVIGANEDKIRADLILDYWPSKSINLCGQIDPRVCAGILANSSFFIGHDSGPLHLAASVQIPCIGIYSENNPPKKWYPYGEDHLILQSMSGIDKILPDEVFKAVKSILDRIDSKHLGVS